MGRAVLLCGKDATTPYRFANPDIPVWSIEELCYLMKENAFLLEKDIMDRRLVAWIDAECGLEDLAASLYPLLTQKGTVNAFVLTILQYVGCYGRETIEEVDRLLSQGANLSTYEKYKVRVDHMAGSGRYAEAAAAYDALMEELPQEESRLRADLWHNKGVALTGLFLFEQAADCFLRSYELCPERETYVAYLAAERMHLSESDYISFVAQLPDAYEASLELERRVEALGRSWESQIDRQRLEQMKQWKAYGESVKYYEEAQRMIQGLKHSYRVGVGEV